MEQTRESNQNRCECGEKATWLDTEHNMPTCDWMRDKMLHEGMTADQFERLED